MLHKFLAIKSKSRDELTGFLPEEVLLEHIPPSSMQPLLCDPIHVANEVYYRTVTSLHAPELGFRTPASHYNEPLGAALAGRCFATKIKPWMHSFKSQQSPTPIYLAEMGGGEGLLLHAFLKHLTTLIMAEACNVECLIPDWKTYIHLVLLDQSPQFLEKQKKCGRQFGVTVVETEPIDLGKPISRTDQHPWMEDLFRKIDFIYTCELLDDISGGQVIGEEDGRWYHYSTLFIVPEKQINPEKEHHYCLASTQLNPDILVDFPRTQYLLNHEQIVDHLEYCIQTGKSYGYGAITIKEPYDPPVEIFSSGEMKCCYLNSFTGIREILEIVCSPTADMTHLDYYTCGPIERVGFYPLDQFFDIPDAWVRLILKITDPPIQQPTVHVSMPQAIQSFSPWNVKELPPNQLRRFLSVYASLGIPLAFSVEDTEFCMAQHSIISTAFI